MLRTRDHRPSFNYTVLEPIAGNFYPLNSGFMRDTASGLTLSVVTDRAQACASIQDGELEVLIQRRLLQDDRQGVDEPLLEPGLTGEIKRELTDSSCASSILTRSCAHVLEYYQWLALCSHTGFDCVPL